jgi:opacity protein-like surface antigen
MRVFFILIGISILTSSNLLAQEDHKFLVGGTFGFSYSSYNGSSDQPTQSISLLTSPIAGYFITKNIALGIGVGLGNSNTKFVDNLNESTKDLEYVINPFIRYYFNQGLFVQGQFNVGESKNTTTLNKEVYESIFGGPFVGPLELSSNESFTGFGIGLGYDIALSNQVKLEPMVRYIANNRNNKSSEEKYNESKIYFNLGFIILL